MVKDPSLEFVTKISERVFLCKLGNSVWFLYGFCMVLMHLENQIY